MPFDGYRFRNVPTEADDYPATVCLGRIVNVDYDNWTVDVELDSNGAVYESVQVGMPYFYGPEGEGFFAAPEVGSRCAVVIPSDSSDPFILCFLAFAEDAAPYSSTTPQEAETAEDEPSVEISYRNGRPALRPGDMAIAGRDGNFFILRRGGALQIGASPAAQRIFIPIRNLIQDFAENYGIELAGGKMKWEIISEDDDNHAVKHEFIWREYAEDAEGSVLCQIGELGDNYFKFVIAPRLVDIKSGEIKGDVTFELAFSKDGERILQCKKETITVNGDRKIVITGSLDESCDSYTQKVNKNREISFKKETKKGQTSTENLTRKKEIIAPSVLLAGGNYMVVTELLIDWLNSHQHPAGDPTTGPPSTPIMKQLVCSSKVKVGK